MSTQELLIEVCGPSELGQYIGRTAQGQLYIEQKGHWEFFNFNEQYAGYYPMCSFTAIAVVEGAFYVAGVDENGEPHVFFSIKGGVWKHRLLTMQYPGHGVMRPSGKVIRILYDEILRQIFLVSQHGQIITLPSCPKCVRILQVSCKEVIDASINGQTIMIFFVDGTHYSISTKHVAQYRVSMTFMRKLLRENDGLLVDLRSENEYAQRNLPNSINVPIHFLYEWLESQEKSELIIFVCHMGFKADLAVQLAQERGFTRVYSLGGIDEEGHVE